jgi:hypothetical protein
VPLRDHEEVLPVNLSRESAWTRKVRRGEAGTTDQRPSDVTLERYADLIRENAEDVYALLNRAEYRGGLKRQDIARLMGWTEPWQDQLAGDIGYHLGDGPDGLGVLHQAKRTRATSHPRRPFHWVSKTWDD